MAMAPTKRRLSETNHFGSKINLGKILYITVSFKGNLKL